MRLTNLSKDFSFGSAFMALGLSKTDWRGQSLPMDLGSLGLWGCSSFTSVEVAFPLVSFLGTAIWSFEIPNHGSLVGTPFYNQGFVLDVGANPAGFIVSNGGEGVIGGG